MSVPSITGPQGGEPFGKYRLTRRLATGGMAEIFLATLEGPGGFVKRCAIKRILPQYSRSQDFCQMLMQEAKVGASLAHPNVVQIYEFGSIGDHYYISLEYVDGASLHQIIRKAAEMKSALGVRIACHIGVHVAAALAYAHALTDENGRFLNLVHRDVTPGNILLSRTGQVKLADFGIVKLHGTDNQTRAGVIKGKFAYMSPEQISAQQLDRRSDIFSMGVVLYEVALGRRLFRRSDPAAELLAVSTAEVPRPTDIEPNFPPAFEAILLKALAKDRQDRYSSAEELQADLERFASSQGWTTTGRPLAALMQQLFPAGHEPEGAYAMDAVVDPSFGTPASRPSSRPTTSSRRQVRRKRTKTAAMLAIGVCTALTALLWLFLLVLPE